MKYLILITILSIVFLKNSSFANSNSSALGTNSKNNFTLKRINNSLRENRENLKNKKILIRDQKKSSLRRNKRRLRLREVSARISVRGLLDTGELEKGNLSIDYEALNWVESQGVSEIESIKFLNE
jgi:hypothetical protein